MSENPYQSPATPAEAIGVVSGRREDLIQSFYRTLPDEFDVKKAYEVGKIYERTRAWVKYAIADLMKEGKLRRVARGYYEKEM